MAPSLTLFFIVEPPVYQNLACYLAASIRRHMPPEVELVGYCPANRMDKLAPEAVEALRRMGCEVRPMQTEGRFDPIYPHGNKILACLEPRGTEWSGFMDSDILLIDALDPGDLVRPGHVSASAAASMHWTAQTIWGPVYDAFGLEVPETRIRLMRDRRRVVLPYYSAGFVLFPETHRTPKGQSFPEVWYDTACGIDAIPDLPGKRPYLDQLSLPVAIARAGLGWNELPEERHYILGGVRRRDPLPQDKDISVVHYRRWKVLEWAGIADKGYFYLRKAIGVRRVHRVFSQPAPEDVAEVNTGSGS